jgi:hypothetical protein
MDSQWIMSDEYVMKMAVLMRHIQSGPCGICRWYSLRANRTITENEVSIISVRETVKFSLAFLVRLGIVMVWLDSSLIRYLLIVDNAEDKGEDTIKQR